MGIKSTALPQVASFNSGNDFIVNGPDGTGRITGDAAASFFANYFEYPLYHYEGADLVKKFADEIARYTDFGAWLKARLTARNLTGIHIKDYFSFTTRNNITFKARVADINHDLGYGDTVVTAWHIDFICDELWPENHVWNMVSYNNGLSSEGAPWLVSDIKAFLNSEKANVPNGTDADPETVAVDYTTTGVYDKLPAWLQAVIVERRSLEPTRYTAGSLLTDDNSWAWKDIGKLWLPNEIEVYGFTVWGTRIGYSIGETHQFLIFRDGKMRIKRKPDGSRSTFWCRSVRSGDSVGATRVYYHGNPSRGGATDASVAVPVCFRISG